MPSITVIPAKNQPVPRDAEEAVLFNERLLLVATLLYGIHKISANFSGTNNFSEIDSITIEQGGKTINSFVHAPHRTGVLRWGRLPAFLQQPGPTDENFYLYTGSLHELITEIVEHHIRDIESDWSSDLGGFGLWAWCVERGVEFTVFGTPEDISVRQSWTGQLGEELQ